MSDFTVVSKLSETENINTVATHNGKFHADEVLTCCIIAAFHGPIVIVRTRDQAVMDSARIVVDVGGVFDGDRAFDHHQFRNGDHLWGHAACSLVWSELGVELLIQRGLSPIDAMEVAEAIADRLILPVAHMDTGVFEGELSPLNLNALVSAMNPGWEEGFVSGDEEFSGALDVVAPLLEAIIAQESGRVAAANIVRGSVIIGQTLVLTQFCPWQEEVCTDPKFEEVLFVVFQSGNDDWRIQSVPKELGKFGARQDLPEEWAGLRGAELADVTGVAEAVFCHAGRFIAGATTKQAILELARKAS